MKVKIENVEIEVEILEKIVQTFVENEAFKDVIYDLYIESTADE